VLVAGYALLIAFLMVSRLPTLSGKRIGQRIPRDNVLPVLVLAVLVVGLLASYPFSFLAIASVLYLAHLPFAWRAWKRADAKSARHAESETCTDA
nr:CDP-diacylglycerol--serine O-phosphatidyltransferase [Hyphomicrobiales bacterium]